MKKYTTIAQLCILGTLTLIVVGIFSYLYIVIEKKNIYISETTATIDNLKSARDERLLLTQTLRSTEIERDTLASFFVDDKTIVPFIETVEGYGKKANAPIVIANVDTDPDRKTLVFKVSASGSFKNIYHLVHMIESAPFELKITDLSLSVVGAGQNQLDDLLPADPVWTSSITLELISFSTEY